MLRIGLTGNIGSGKTLVCHIFAQLGVPIYYSDKAGKRISEQSEVRKAISNTFGTSVLQTDGSLNREALANIVFTNRAALNKLNHIIHPHVRNDYAQWCNTHSLYSYTIMESAILFEHKLYQTMDYNICVSAPSTLRIQRVMHRDGINQKAVKIRMQNQWEEAKKTAMANFVIYNDEQQMLLPQILRIHEHLLTLYKLTLQT